MKSYGKNRMIAAPTTGDNHMNTIQKELKKTVYGALLLMTLLMAGCGGSGTITGGGTTNQGTVNVTPSALLASVTTAVSNPANVARSLGGWDWVNFSTSFGTLLSSLSYTLDIQKITYQSIGADGLTHTMSGLLIMPRAVFGARPAVPILMYQHGTEPYRQFSPSQFLAHQDRPADYPEVMVAAAIAASGYAVAMTDYEGLGDSIGTQPYVNGAVLARQVIDMLRASRDRIATASSPCTWNNQLFLMGYSEGGYVTMTTTRELQLRHAAEFTVTAAASLSGPHDLSGTMRNEILSNNPSKAPYFLPFLLSGYNYSYGSQSSIFSPLTTLISPFSSTLPPLFTGTTPSDQISEKMGMVFNPVSLIVPKNVLTTSFTSLLSTATLPGSAFSFLRQNDSFRDPLNGEATWRPTVPIRMYHHVSDDLVPYGNSQVAFDSFSTIGGKRHGGTGGGVELVRETVSVSISPTDPSKTVHQGAAFPELSNGWNWLNGFKR
jgi:pimeloyl-ACP methyl ester carboxylesterase